MLPKTLKLQNPKRPETQKNPLPLQIRDANRAMLLAAAQDIGCEVLDLGIAGDRAGDLERKLDAALEQGADVLLTSGGVSMGDKDLVKPLLEKRGTVHFGRVRDLYS